MKLLLLILFLALMPLLLGQGAVAIYDEITHRRSRVESRYVSGVLLMITAAGAANAFGVFRKLPLSEISRLFGVLLIALGTLSYLAWMILRIRSYRSDHARGSKKDSSGSDGTGKKTIVILVLALGIILAQLLYVLLSGHISLRGDITVETVNSFLQTDALHQINPMTGNPYTVGVPNRLKLMALPTFYAMLCRVFDVSPQLLVWHIMPAYWLLCGYLAYGALARSFFPEADASSVRRRYLFLLLITILVYATDSGLGMDGFGLLHAGYRETAVRAWVLMPILLSWLLERRWLQALLPLLAEALIVWTLFGTGAGFLLYLGIALGTFLSRKRLPGEEVRV